MHNAIFQLARLFRPATRPLWEELRDPPPAADVSPAGVLKLLTDRGCRGPGDRRGPLPAPFAAVLAPADLPARVEAVFGCEPGDLYVVQPGADLVTESALASLEFAAGAGVRVVYVLHAGDRWSSAAADAATRVRADLTRLVARSPWLSARAREGRVVLGGGVYDLVLGRVDPVAVRL